MYPPPPTLSSTAPAGPAFKKNRKEAKEPGEETGNREGGIFWKGNGWEGREKKVPQKEG